MATTKLQLDRIRLDGGTQPRATIAWEVVNQYAEDMAEGHAFPPVVVFYDGTDHWLADGFHRFNAAEQSDWKEIDADVRQGTVRDAILYSVGANANHGVRRTNDDKRRAVTRLLGDSVWSTESNNWIATKCGVSLDLVNRMRHEIAPLNESLSDPIRRTSNGRTMNTANIGKNRAPRLDTSTADDDSHEEVTVIDGDTGEEIANPVIHTSKSTVQKPTPLPRFERRQCVFESVDIRPDDPAQGAQALVATFTRDYLLKLIDEIKSRLSHAA